MSVSALIILHEGFEEIEAVSPIDILRRGGVEVTVAAQTEPLKVKGRNGMTLLADCSLEDVIDQAFDAIVLPGGPGIPQNVRGDDRIISLLKHQTNQNKLTAAICAAPIILKDAGLLDGKRYTAHFSVESELSEIDSKEAVVEDGTIITSRGAGTATLFGLAILARLTDPETAQSISESICLMQVQ